MKLTKEKKKRLLSRSVIYPSFKFFTLTFLFLLRIEKVHLPLSLFLSLYFITFITFILLYLHILRSFYELNILLLYGAENSRRQSPPGYYVIR
ncbi:XXYS1_4_G0041610.mRNA.1.CDS.1 [Saccharomyces cerevisiae]|nr:XXYS1_4_G0041610.mRNA.1.CDS.1 [Saccharomyces cerevisiae]